MPPTFSVVIPTFNRAEYLRAALKSVVDQTFQDFEIIVVDNHSEDHTVSVVEQLNDARVRLIKFKNNGVIAASRNVGIKASRGAYVAFLDSDDTWYPNKLERISRTIQDDPQVGLIGHDQLLVRDGQVERRTYFGPPPGYRGTMYDFQLQVGNGPVTSATVVKRQYLDETEYFSEDPALNCIEDVDLWIRLSAICRFQFISEVLGVRTFHSGGITADVELHVQATLTMLGRHYGGLHGRHGSYPKRTIRRHYARISYNGARDCQRQGAYKQALGFYARTFRTDPFQLKAYGGLALLLADLLLGQGRRRSILGAILGPSRRWD